MTRLTSAAHIVLSKLSAALYGPALTPKGPESATPTMPMNDGPMIRADVAWAVRTVYSPDQYGPHRFRSCPVVLS